MSVLTRKKMLETQDLKQKTMDVPEWGGQIIVREMSVREKAEWDEAVFKRTYTEDGTPKITADYKDADAILVVKCVIDDEGKRVFADSDLLEVGKKSSRVIQRIANAVRALSGMTPEAEEVLGKDSNALPREDTPSS